MNKTNSKLQILQDKLLKTDDKIRIMIFGLGSVGLYLLDYLISLSNPRLELIVVGRNPGKMQSDVNIVRTAATIRRQCRSNINIDVCDLENIPSIADVISKWNPDFIVNSSRVYSGLKYGSISWTHLRAYGIWTPLSVKYAKNIMRAYSAAKSNAITINTSYSDAVIPWLKSSCMDFYDFGSGNLNHLIPRMKFYIAEKYSIANPNDIKITLAVSHFHDVVISKEGHAENQDILLDVEYDGHKLKVDKTELLKACKIPMPVDQKRNMMNASSNFDIINSILDAIMEHKKVIIHSPGVFGEIGGYPVIIDGENTAKAYIDDTTYPLEEMRDANRKSIYLDGIEAIDERGLTFTDELISKVKKQFMVEIPKTVSIHDSEKVAQLLIDQVIRPTIGEH
jgi:hypothetical protein